MTTKPKARKYRIRRSTPLASGQVTIAQAQASLQAGAKASAAAKAEAETARKLQANRGEAPAPVAPPADGQTPDQQLDALRKEGLTGRQLRMARRVAQKHGLAVTSDFDAVRQLRAKGIDPFLRSNILELVVPNTDGSGAPTPGADPVMGAGMGPAGQPAQLPQTTSSNNPGNLPAVDQMDPAERRALEIAKVQRGMAKRRRRKSALLFSRLAMFVFVPTIAAGWYFYAMATPMFATKSEFVIQQAESQGGGAGFGGLFAGTSAATQQDSTTVQSYLTSRAALLRLDEEHGFKDHFSDPDIDVIQRLPEGATNEATFELYQDHVRISYDPTEGIIRMEVIAVDPETSQTYSEALIQYAEEQVDHLTQRLREDQMAGARTNYEQAEARRDGALADLLDIQQKVQQIDPVGETAARIQQISALETQRQDLQVSLSQRLNVSAPNEAQVNALRNQIESIDTLIADMRSEMTASGVGGSLAANNTELRRAEENYQFQVVLVQQALAAMETARIEASRQVRYLSLGVEPIAPDEATYPRAFENTALSFLVFAGIYLMISLTASILREQVNS
jgi:capsular polysaccharide transport system permease protein